MFVTEKAVLAKKHPSFLIAAIVFGVILNPLNTTMITVALPQITNEFLLTSNDITWLIASYFIVSAVFMPLLGKISDIYGRKKIFLFGLVLVGISSFTAPLSPNMPFLLGMRAIQAIGTAALFPAGIGIVRSYIEENQHRVIGTLAVFSTTSAAFGPTISGLLIGYGGWKVIFYVNFPIIIASAILTILFIPNDEKSTRKGFKWDGIGIVLFGSLISCWMYFFQTLQSGFHLGPFISSLALTFLFYFFEKKKTEPFIDVLFLKKNLNITFVYIQYIFSTVIFFALLLSMPIYLQTVLHLSSQITGIMMLAISVFSIIVTPIVTRWIEKVGYRTPLLTGGIIGIIGVAFLLAISQNSSLSIIFIVLSIIGISNGIFNIGLQTLLYTFVSVEESGTASGLFMTSRFIGNILASSIFGVIFVTGVNDVNQNWMTVILMVITLIMIPGILYITKGRTSTNSP